jgi:RNA polymerase sigma factor (sigma-70 family)
MTDRNQALMTMWPYIAKKAIAMARRNPRTDWRDLAHTAVVKVLKSWHNFRPEWGLTPLTYFGLGIAREMVRHLKRHHTVIRRPDKAPPGPKVLSEDDEADNTASKAISRLPGPLEQAANNEELTRLREAVARLPEKHRDIVTRIMAGEPAKEIAKSRGRTRQWVYQIEAVAHRKLKRKLEPQVA